MYGILIIRVIYGYSCVLSYFTGGKLSMSYFFDSNEEVEFKRIDGILYLYVIHRNHQHQGMQPHAHILNLSSLSLDEAFVRKDLNIYCGKAKDEGEVIPYK